VEGVVDAVEQCRAVRLDFHPALRFRVESIHPPLVTLGVRFVLLGQPDPGAIVEARQLKWIHISSSGITRYDTPEFRAHLTERNIPLTNSAGVFNEACAVHALSFMLAAARNLPRALELRTTNGSDEWHALRGSCTTLRGETVLILGFGAIGRRLAELLRPFGLNVIGYRRKARGDEAVPIITQERLGNTLGKADHIVNILPDSPETRHFFDASRFLEVKPGATFYNIGRGTTVDQEALLDALRSGSIGGAWLDVTDPEPLPDDHPLRAEPNCFITPHVAGGHIDEAKTVVRHFLNNLERFVSGEPFVDRVM
jgi:phosphoglycerate dehydrogenase-like enzyme